MAKTATSAGPAEPPANRRHGLRSDGSSSTHGYLGDFARGPALFTVYKIPPDQGCYPNVPGFYLIDVDDGVGARECCRFTDEPDDVPEWNGSWRGDPWCPAILKQAKALIAKAASR